MEPLPVWKPEYTLPFLAISAVSVCFTIYWFLGQSRKLESWFFSRFTGDQAWISFIVMQKSAGFVFLGLVPGIIMLSSSNYTLTSLGLNLKNWPVSLAFIAIMGSLILFMNYFNTKKPASLSAYPQMRIKVWNKRKILINSIAWTAYLLAYEFLFRGILLFICCDAFGFWPAAAINLALYSATHIPKGLTETIGTYPYGLLLCLLTISSGSILVAFATHLIMALSNDYFSVHHNPEMHFA